MKLFYPVGLGRRLPSQCPTGRRVPDWLRIRIYRWRWNNYEDLPLPNVTSIEVFRVAEHGIIGSYLNPALLPIV